MMDGGVLLNLGCGPVYKPGYVNVDRFDGSVADVIADIGQLPFKPNSIDEMEACQVLEHSDHVHCRYVLAEWFRVLRPQGTLILETPDLEKTSRRLVRGQYAKQKTALQWVYGIDSRGMHHKTGFTFGLLRRLLEESGFERVLRQKPRTHRYEHGIRAVCSKPVSCRDSQLFASFRSRLKVRLKTDDSCILIPLESWLERARAAYAECREDRNTCVDRVLSRTVLCHPSVSLAFVEECLASGLVAESDMTARVEILNWLGEIQFHQRLFSLWMKTRRNVDRLEDEARDFVARHESMMMDTLRDSAGYKARLEYLANLEPTSIEVFDFLLVSLEARKSFGLGVKCFHQGRFAQAFDCFLRSSRMDPGQLLAYWNMGRLGCILRTDEYDTIGNYEEALKLAGRSRTGRQVETELRSVREGRSHLVPREPVLEESLTVPRSAKTGRK
ncbi:MAG: methyltransferase domain-containing protein [Chloroflexi bacterium]|nr:methyltransferase domain-containing protein [Chloroflexota bacterium]